MRKLVFIMAMLVLTISANAQKDTLTTITKTTVEPDYKYKIVEQYVVKMMQVIQERMVSEKLQNDSIPFAAETKRFISDVQKALVKYQSAFVVNKEINVSKKKINKEIAKIEKWKAKVDADPELTGAQNTKVYARKMKRLAELKEMKKAAKKSRKVKVVDKTLGELIGNENIKIVLNDEEIDN